MRWRYDDDEDEDEDEDEDKGEDEDEDDEEDDDDDDATFRTSPAAQCESQDKAHTTIKNLRLILSACMSKTTVSTLSRISATGPAS